jgi:hypothetical protein
VLQTDDWQVEQKADTSPLTRADREANTIICDGLARIGGCASPSCYYCAAHIQAPSLTWVPACLLPAAPHIPIVSEENRQVSHDTRKVGGCSRGLTSSPPPHPTPPPPHV